jgi:hypothetical protein
MPNLRGASRADRTRTLLAFVVAAAVVAIIVALVH